MFMMVMYREGYYLTSFMLRIIQEFRSQFEIKIFISLNTLNYGTLINKTPYQTISTFFIEIHLVVFLEVLLMGGLDFFLSKLVDRYHRKIH